VLVGAAVLLLIGGTAVKRAFKSAKVDKAKDEVDQELLKLRAAELAAQRAVSLCSGRFPCRKPLIWPFTPYSV
jgi:hypothetical protein